MSDPKPKFSLADAVLGDSSDTVVNSNPNKRAKFSLADAVLGPQKTPKFQDDFLSKITEINRAQINPSKSEQVDSLYSDLSKQIAQRYKLDEDDARDFIKVNAQKDFNYSGYDLKTDLDNDAKESGLSFNEQLLQVPQDATNQPNPLIGNEDALLKANGFDSFEELYEKAEEVKLGPGLEGTGFNLDQEVEVFKNRKGRGEAALDAFQYSTKELAYGLGDLLVEGRKKGLEFSEYLGGLTKKQIQEKKAENESFSKEIDEARKQNEKDNLNNEYEGYATNKIASAVPSFVPMVTGAAISRFNPQLGATIMQSGFAMLSGSSAGSAMREYEEYQKAKGREVDELDKWAIGVGSAGVEYITERLPMNKFLGRNVRKNLASGALKRRVKLSPQDNLDLGKDILKSYAKKQPSQYKKFISELKDVGREGAGEASAELLQNAITNYYKDNKDQLKGNQLVKNMADAFFIGSAMRAGISPLSYNNQDRAINQRRQAQGGVVLTEYNGEAVEVISRKEKDGKLQYTAMYPDGEVVEIDSDKTSELFKLSNDQFQNLLRAKGEEKSANEAIRTEKQFQDREAIDTKFATDEALQINEEGVEVFREGIIKQDDQEIPVTIVNTNGNKATIRYPNDKKGIVNVHEIDDVKEFNKDDYYQIFGVDYIPNTPFKSPSAGEQIVHPTYGEGRVISYDPNNGNATLEFTDNTDPNDPQPLIETDVPRATVDQYRGLYSELKTVNQPEAPIEVQEEEEIDPFNDSGEIDLNPKEDDNRGTKESDESRGSQEVGGVGRGDEKARGKTLDEERNPEGRQEIPTDRRSVSKTEAKKQEVDESDGTAEVSKKKDSAQDETKSPDGAVDNNDNAVRDLAERISRGDTQFTAEDLQLQINEPKKLEKELNRISNLNNNQNAKDSSKTREDQERVRSRSENSQKDRNKNRVRSRNENSQKDRNKNRNQKDQLQGSEKKGILDESDSNTQSPDKKAEGKISGTDSVSKGRKQSKQDKVNTLLDKVDSYNKLSKRDKDAAAVNSIKVEATNLGYKIKNVGGDLQFEGTKPRRVNKQTATSKTEGFTPLRKRGKKTQKFVDELIKNAESAPEGYNPFQGMQGISVPTKGMRGFIKDIKRGKNTQRAQDFLNTIDEYVAQGYVPYTTGYYQQVVQAGIDDVIASFEEVNNAEITKTEEVFEEVFEEPPFQRIIAKKKLPDPTTAASTFVNPWIKKNKAELEKVAKKIVNKIGKNRPELEIYESDLDLILNYPHLAAKIRADERAGFYTMKNGRPTVILIGTNPKFRDKDGNIDQREVADTVIHEMIGHYGLRGSMNALNGRKIELQKALDESLPGMKKARLDELTKRYTEGRVNVFNDLSPISDTEAYYEVLEEYVAHEVQLNNLDGSPKRNGVTKSVIDYIKGLLEKMGFKFSDTQLRRLIAGAKKYVEVGENNFVQRKSVSLEEVDTMKQLGQIPEAFQMGVNYGRVIPRDFFNEAKTISMYGRFADFLNQGKLPDGFTIERTSDDFGAGLSEDGEMYSTGVQVYYNGDPVNLTVTYNSGKTDRFPLMITDVDNDVWGITVFDGNGDLDSEFTDQYGEPSGVKGDTDVSEYFAEQSEFLKQMGVVGLWSVDRMLPREFNLDTIDFESGFDINYSEIGLQAFNVEATYNGNPVTFFIPNGQEDLHFEFNGEVGKVIEGFKDMSSEFKETFNIDNDIRFQKSIKFEDYENVTPIQTTGVPAKELQKKRRDTFQSAYNDIGRGVSSVGADEQIALQHKNAKEYAEKNGLLIKSLEDLGTPTDFGGMENKIAINPKKGEIYKSNNLLVSKGNILDHINYIQRHNYLFPETPYDLVGFQEITKNKELWMKPVVKQRFISDARKATQEEIDAYMKEMGFYSNDRKSFSYENGEFEISDLKPANVLFKDGEIFVIDDINKKFIQEDFKFQKITFQPKKNLSDRQAQKQDEIKEKYKEYRKLVNCFNS